eukprot:342541-Pleurochrysis_carterae.AAC.1
MASLFPESAMEEGELGESTPFWIGQIASYWYAHVKTFLKVSIPDVSFVAADEFGRRREPINPNDEFMFQCCTNPDPQTGYITRSSILLYNVELTGKAARLNRVTKESIVQAIVAASDKVASMLPSSWGTTKKQ